MPSRGAGNPNCAMCDDTGRKDYAGLGLDPCDHQLPAAVRDEPADAIGDAIRNAPYDVNDDYQDVRRDERERVIARLAAIRSGSE